MTKPFFVTTPIYYANGLPHIGHAYTTVAADVIARYQRQQGAQVFFSTGTDEHGAKIAEKAAAEGIDPQVFVDGIAQHFAGLWQALNISNDAFIRTTSPAHKTAVQNVLQRLYDQGAIYKGQYEGLYCVGCEQFKMESDLVDGKCPDHDRVPELMTEESYMLKMTELQATLLEKIKTGALNIQLAKYRNEMLSFLEGQALEDVSISRKNVTWGIPLPFDPSHTTYVWVDAFLNYLTVLGWDGTGDAPAAWPANIQFMGKDILRVHATIWQVLLLHLGFAVTETLFVHGHILSGGKKMSKTLGNVIAIDEMIEIFGADGTRYLLLSAGHFGEDIDITLERLREKYNADLANGLGNLVSRVLKLAEQLEQPFELSGGQLASPQYQAALDAAQLSQALEETMQLVRSANEYMSQEEPWKLVKEETVGAKARFQVVMHELLSRIERIAFELQPFMPSTAVKIQIALKTGEVTPLFQRLS
jgi:methionyl-tRNA synthetase